MSLLPGSAISLSGYDINNSLRFRRSASAYLSRTMSASGTTCTWSFWVKRGQLGVIQGIFDWTDGVNTSFGIEFTAGAPPVVSDTIDFYNFSSSYTMRLVTTQVFRDPSSWYHIVAVIDTTNATSSDRARLYVNGQIVTAFSTATYPAQNTSMNISTARAFDIGATGASHTQNFDGYLAEFNFIDGQALTPSSFGETDAITGVWKPKAYAGTYGTNGFYLKFSDIALTSGSNTGLGRDFSGNGNFWNTNNISVTSGATYDAMTDSPTNTSVTVANYPVLNWLDRNTSANLALSNANLTMTTIGVNFGVRASMYIPAGKWYWEVTVTTGGGDPLIGIADAAWALGYVGESSGSYGYSGSGLKYNGPGAGAAYGASFTTGDVIGVTFDTSTGTLIFYKNSVSQGSAYTGLTGVYAPAISGQTNNVLNINFGQRPFAYTPPTGFNRLNTYNLPDSTIVKGDSFMDATIYAGNGASPRSITNAASFRPDFVWIKNRSSAAFPHVLTDSVRGVNNSLFSNLTNSAVTNDVSGWLSAFNANGFSVSAGTSDSRNVNASGNNYVGWQWQAGQGTNTTNTAGSITSTVSVNTTAGFSIVTYTGTAANATVGHGLGVAPKFIIIKNRSTSVDWRGYHASIGATAAFGLNLTATPDTNIAYFNNTNPTSSVFSLGNGLSVNGSGNSMVAYCWAEIAGFSRFGSYTGNGNADGPFVYTGFRPKFVMIKNSSAATSWTIFDSVRFGYNLTQPYLVPNTAGAEGNVAGFGIDILSNGFKPRTADATINGSTNTHIYAAFAENPFKNALAR